MSFCGTCNRISRDLINLIGNLGFSGDSSSSDTHLNCLKTFLVLQVPRENILLIGLGFQITQKLPHSLRIGIVWDPSHYSQFLKDIFCNWSTTRNDFIDLLENSDWYQFQFLKLIVVLAFKPAKIWWIWMCSEHSRDSLYVDLFNFFKAWRRSIPSSLVFALSKFQTMM